MWPPASAAGSRKPDQGGGHAVRAAVAAALAAPWLADPGAGATALAPAPRLPAEVRSADYLIPHGGGNGEPPRPDGDGTVRETGSHLRKRFHVRAWRLEGGRPRERELENVQEVVTSSAGAAVVRWRLGPGTATESFAVMADGRLRVTERRSWSHETVFREYPAVLGTGSGYREWTEGRAARAIPLRIAAAEQVEAAGRVFETLVFEADDPPFRFKTWQARGLGEIRSEVWSGPVRISRRTLVALAPRAAAAPHH